VLGAGGPAADSASGLRRMQGVSAGAAGGGPAGAQGDGLYAVDTSCTVAGP